MAFGQHQPVVPGVLDQPTARLHQPLLQAGQRPVVDSRRLRQPPPQIPRVVREHPQSKPHLVRPEAVGAQLDLRQQQFFPVVGTVHVGGPQFCRQAVAFPIE